MAKYDPAEKWLIEHYGDSILRLAGVENIESWKAVHPEVVQPGRLPDGLLEVQLKGETETDLFLLELATYSEPRLEEQIAREMLLVFADRGIVPECVGLVLHPKGTFVPSDGYAVASRLGFSEFRFRWRIVKLWELEAETLLAAGDVGLIPWVPLTQSDEQPERVFQQCRDVIDNSAPTELRDRMLVVTHVLASLRYDEDVLSQYFGGEEKMIEFPAIQSLVAKARHGDIIRYLRSQFGTLPPTSNRACVQLPTCRHLTACSITWAIAARSTNFANCSLMGMDDRLQSSRNALHDAVFGDSEIVAEMSHTAESRLRNPPADSGNILRGRWIEFHRSRSVGPRHFRSVRCTICFRATSDGPSCPPV